MDFKSPMVPRLVFRAIWILAALEVSRVSVGLEGMTMARVIIDNLNPQI